MNGSAMKKNNRNPHEGIPQDIGNEIAWKWFSYHAEQRLHSFRFFLTVIGLLGAAYGFCMRSPNESTYPVAIAVSLFSAICSIGFWMLDVRNTELVWVGRVALGKIYSQIVKDIRNDDDQRTCLGESTGILSWPLEWKLLHFLTRHQLWFRVILILSFFLSLMGALYAYYKFNPSTVLNSFPFKWHGPINIGIIGSINIAVVLIVIIVCGTIHIKIVKQRDKSTNKKKVTNTSDSLHVV